MNVYQATITGMGSDGAGTKYVVADTSDEAWDKFYAYANAIRTKDYTPEIATFQRVGELLKTKVK